LFLGIDIGTTAIKLGLIEKNRLCYSQSMPIHTYGNETIKYQKAAEIIALIEEEIRAIPRDLREDVDTISFSTAMHSLMPKTSDENNVFLWSDQQAIRTIDRFKKNQLRAQHFYNLTGTPIHPMSTFAKILYFQEEKRYPEYTKWLGLKELVLHHFTKETVIDYSTASATGLFDLQEKQWSEEILEFLQIDQSQLAQTVDTTMSFSIDKKIATYLGLSSKVQVVAGASDGCLATLASFCATNRTSSLTIGTSAAVRQLVEQVQLDDTTQHFCYYLNEKYFVIGAPSNNGGCVLEWAQKNLADNKTTFFNQLPEILTHSSVGAHGLRFFPYLNGERAPLWNPHLKAGFSNIDLTHTRSDMIRATIEGMLLNIRRLTQSVANHKALSVSGGFFQTETLGQLACDILGVPCYYSTHNEPIFGLYHLVVNSNDSTLHEEKVFQPQPEISRQYQFLADNYFK